MASSTGIKENKKVTFSLPVDLLEEVRQLVQDGVTPSQSAFVATALEKEIYARRRAQLRKEFQRAAADPEFLKDVEETMRDFAAADAETARMIP